MRKHALKWLLCLALVLSLVPAAMADEVTPPHVSADGHESCIDLNTYNEGELSTVGTTLEEGVYYLSDELIIEGSEQGGGHFFLIEAGTEVTVCLNGYGLITEFTDSEVDFTQVGFKVNGTLNLCDCVGGGFITHNNASNNGGATVIVNSGGIFNMYGGNITGNMGSRYGIVYANAGTINMYDGKISGNSTNANYDQKNGGGIGVTTAGKFNMYGGEISGNVAHGSGGGVYVSSSNSAAVIAGGVIKDNISYATQSSSNPHYGGGGIAAFAGTLTVKGGTISGNKAENGSGGGITTHNNCTLKVSGDAVIEKNLASRGGGIYSRSTTATISGGKISENTTTTFGGGLHVHAGTMTVSGGTFSGNIGDDGGAMALTGGVLKYEGGTLTGNEADRGGGIYAARDFRMNKAACEIKDNTARLGGGIFQGGTANASNKIRVYGGEISGNTATESGGGLYLTNPAVATTLSNTSKLDGKITISGNTAADGSDGIYNGASSTMLMINGVKVEDASYNVGKFIVNDGTIDSFVTEGDGVLQVLNGKVITGLEGNSELYGGIYPQAYSADYIKLENGVFAPLGDGTYALQVGTNFNGSYMELGEKLDMNVCFADASDAFGYYSYDVPSASIVYTEAAPTTAKITYKDGTTKSVELAQGENGLEVSIDGVSAKEMADSFRIDLYAGDERVYTQVDSARDYAARILDDEDEAASHQLIADMLAYGAAAQKYFNYNTEDLADSVLANFDVEVSDAAAAIAAATPEEDINYAYSRAYHSANLTLENDVDFNLYFWIGQLENTDYTISINGVEQAGVFEECLDATVEDGEPLLYKVKVAGLTYADLVNTEVSITFTPKGATQTTTITDSPVNYLVRNDGKARASLNGTDGSALYGSVLAFANSCVDYNG